MNPKQPRKSSSLGSRGATIDSPQHHASSPNPGLGALGSALESAFNDMEKEHHRLIEELNQLDAEFRKTLEESKTLTARIAGLEKKMEQDHKALMARPERLEKKVEGQTTTISKLEKIVPNLVTQVQAICNWFKTRV
jgi:predicted  nucleic acid-binding Zn-ribbon protein